MSGSSCTVEGTATILCIVPLVTNLIKAVVALAGVALFVMLIVAGFNFLTAGGDPKKLQAAQGTVTQAFVGIIIMSVAYLVVYMIQVITGVNVTTFQLSF